MVHNLSCLRLQHGYALHRHAHHVDSYDGSSYGGYADTDRCAHHIDSYDGGSYDRCAHHGGSYGLADRCAHHGGANYSHSEVFHFAALSRSCLRLDGSQFVERGCESGV